MSKKPNLKVIETDQVPLEILADSIKSISIGMKKLLDSPLKLNALHLLIQHASSGYRVGYSTRKPTITEIKAVIEGINNLEKAYLKQADAKSGK